MPGNENRYVIATVKSWNIDQFYNLKAKYPDKDFVLVNSKDDLSMSFLKEYNPRIIFFPHWSWIIPEEIYGNYECVVFHSTDLPFGRGGSPIQNLLVRGIYNTKVSAIKVCPDIDAGPVYIKEPVYIGDGSIDQILSNISDIIFKKMIPRFLDEELIPVEQAGTVVSFCRRKPEQSEIPAGLSQRQLYDYIRMLDGEGYPPAFIKYNDGKIVLTNAVFENDTVKAQAQFVID